MKYIVGCSQAGTVCIVDQSLCCSSEKGLEVTWVSVGVGWILPDQRTWLGIIGAADWLVAYKLLPL